MEFSYIGDNLENIRIIKDETNSILINLTENISMKKLKNTVYKVI